jgi:hypothetical protein
MTTAVAKAKTLMRTFFASGNFHANRLLALGRTVLQPFQSSPLIVDELTRFRKNGAASTATFASY